MSGITLKSCLNPKQNKTGIYLIVLLIGLPTLASFGGYYISNSINGTLYTEEDLTNAYNEGNASGYTDGFDDGISRYSTFVINISSNFVWKERSSELNASWDDTIDHQLRCLIVYKVGDQFYYAFDIQNDDVVYLDFPITIKIYEPNFKLIGMMFTYENFEIEDAFNAEITDIDGIIALNGYGNYSITIEEIVNKHDSETPDSMKYWYNGVLSTKYDTSSLFS